MPLGIFSEKIGIKPELFQFHFHILTKQHPEEIPMTRFLLYFILFTATTTLAQTPIPRVGDACPTGTYHSGDYGKRIASSDREAIPREDGGKCPTGWYKSGGYCVKYGD